MIVVEFVIALVGAGLTVWAMSIVVRERLGLVSSALGMLGGEWRGDAWPRGVPEEDRDRPWGVPTTALARPHDGRDSPAPSVPLRRVEVRTTLR
jgi:hypothetical protein